MSRRELFGTTILIMAVVSGVLMMHGFEAVSPEPLAAHAQHDVVQHDVEHLEVVSAFGICVFVLVVSAAVSVSLVPEARIVVLGRQRRWARAATAAWRPPPSSSYELCVMRV